MGATPKTRVIRKAAIQLAESASASYTTGKDTNHRAQFYFHIRRRLQRRRVAAVAPPYHRYRRGGIDIAENCGALSNAVNIGGAKRGVARPITNTVVIV